MTNAVNSFVVSTEYDMRKEACMQHWCVGHQIQRPINDRPLFDQIVIAVAHCADIQHGHVSWYCLSRTTLFVKARGSRSRRKACCSLLFIKMISSFQAQLTRPLAATVLCIILWILDWQNK
jgi:hypothetical protein